MSLNEPVHLCMKCFSLNAVSLILENDGNCVDCGEGQADLLGIVKEEKKITRFTPAQKTQPLAGADSDSLPPLGKIETTQEREKDDFQAKVEAELQKELESLGYGEQEDDTPQSVSGELVEMEVLEQGQENVTDIEKEVVQEKPKEAEILKLTDLLGIKKEDSLNKNISVNDKKSEEITMVSASETESEEVLMVSAAEIESEEEAMVSATEIESEEVLMVSAAEIESEEEAMVSTAEIELEEVKMVSADDIETDLEENLEIPMQDEQKEVEAVFSSSFDDFVGIPTLR